MSETIVRKSVPQSKVWKGFLHGVKNRMTSQEVADYLGMKLGSFNSQMNNLRTAFKKDNPNVKFPSLVRKDREVNTVDAVKMLADLGQLQG